MIKTLNVTFDLAVAFSVWCAAICVAVLAMQAMLSGGTVVYHLIHP